MIKKDLLGKKIVIQNSDQMQNFIESNKIFNIISKRLEVLKNKESFNCTCVNKIIKPWYYRDIEKNLYKIKSWDFKNFIIYYKSDINKNGIWDGKSPDIARTYNINFNLYVSKRSYKQKYINYNKELWFYIYDRSLEGLEKQFTSKLLEFTNKINEFKKDKDYNF